MLRAGCKCQHREYCWARAQAKVGDNNAIRRGDGNNAAAERLDDLELPSAQKGDRQKWRFGEGRAPCDGTGVPSRLVHNSSSIVLIS